MTNNEIKPIGSALIDLMKSHGVEEGEAKRAALSIVLNEFVKAGIPMEKAFDIVLGDGSYKKLADEVYDTLTAA